MIFSLLRFLNLGFSPGEQHAPRSTSGRGCTSCCASSLLPLPCGFSHLGISVWKPAIIMNNTEFLSCPPIPETGNISGPLGLVMFAFCASKAPSQWIKSRGHWFPSSGWSVKRPTIAVLAGSNEKIHWMKNLKKTTCLVPSGNFILTQVSRADLLICSSNG